MADEKKSKSQGAKAPKEGGKGGRGGASTSYETSKGRPSGPKEKPRLAQQYHDKVLPALMQKFGYTSVMQAPRLVKIVINMGVGDATTDIKNIDIAASRSRTSSCARSRRSVAWSRCVARGCTSSSTVS